MDQALPLSHYVQMVGNTLRKELQLQRAWVVAELSDVRQSGGHCYMELVEKNDSGQTLAKLRANIWQSTFVMLRQKFLAATGKDISSGLKVMVCGSITHHNVYGLSFNVHDIDPSYTLGDMERQRREILLALQKSGVLNLNKQVPLSPVPQRIAVISAATAAGYGDFQDQLRRNPQGFVFYTKLFPAVMQGEKTGESVMAALDLVEQTIDLWDCVVIIRGGGATTDLNGFDDLQLAYRVATYSLPVIVGIGHERDRTVLDEVANVRCKTPTAVAEFLVDRLATAYTYITDLAQRVRNQAVEKVHGEQRRISALEAIISPLVKSRLEKEGSRLAYIAQSIPNIGKGRIERQLLILDNYRKEVEKSGKQALAKESQRLESLQRLVAVLDPKATIKRGYTITRINGKAVCASGQLKEGDIITTELADATITSRVITEK